MAVQQRKLAFAPRTDKGAGEIRKEIGCFYDRDPTLQTAFDSYNLRCKAIKDISCLIFGILCMHIFNRFRKDDGNGPLKIYKPRKIMARAIREMGGVAFTDYKKGTQTARFLIYAVGEIMELVRTGRSGKCRKSILGRMDDNGNTLRRMTAFTGEEQESIKKSLDEDFFSKITK